MLVRLALRLSAQQPHELREAVAVSYSALRFDPGDQYLGYGVEYRYLYHSWVGFEVQASEFPEVQFTFSPVVGFYLRQVDGAVLAGHKWGRVTLLGEVGGGVLPTAVFGGYTPRGSIYPLRYYPDLLMGGIADVSLSRRWSLTYEVRDNLTFIGPYQEAGFNPPSGVYPAETLNIPEGRVGVAFHFR